MAAHVHTQLRGALVTALTGLTTTAARVYPNRTHELGDAELPGLRVYLLDERVDPESIHQPHVQARQVAVGIDACARASDSDDVTDQIQKEVEVALAGGVTVAGRPIPVVLRASSFEIEPGAVPVGVKTLRFDVELFTLSNAPDALT